MITQSSITVRYNSAKPFYILILNKLPAKGIQTKNNTKTMFSLTNKLRLFFSYLKH